VSPRSECRTPAAVQHREELDHGVTEDLARAAESLWLLPFGYLVYRSGYFPKVIGTLSIVGCFGYLVDTFTHFLAPAVASSIEAIIVAPAASGSSVSSYGYW
jgi:Domain of unknown function (DUF4386)